MAEMFLYLVTSLSNLFIELQTLLTSRRVSCKSAKARSIMAMF